MPPRLEIPLLSLAKRVVSRFEIGAFSVIVKLCVTREGSFEARALYHDNAPDWFPLSPTRARTSVSIHMITSHLDVGTGAVRQYSERELLGGLEGKGSVLKSTLICCNY